MFEKRFWWHLTTNTTKFKTLSRCQSYWEKRMISHKPFCRTALAGLLPAIASFARCWWLSASVSSSANLALRAMAGWFGSWVRFRYAARLNCSSMTSPCSNSCNHNSTREVKYHNMTDLTTRINCKISGSMHIMMLSNTTIFSSRWHFSHCSFGKSVINQWDNSQHYKNV